MKRYLILLFNIVFLFTGLSLSKTLIDKVVASINNEVILLSDLDLFIEKSKSKNFFELYGPVSPAVLSSKKNLLNLLVEEKIINQHVIKMGLEASEQEVEGQIRSILKRNNISMDQLIARLRQLDTDIADYKASIRRQIERKNLIEKEIKPLLQVSDSQLQYYYQKHMPSKSSTTVRLSQILISNPNKKKHLTEIWETVSSEPEKFDTFAKEYSDDSMVSENSGDLGFFSVDVLSKEFQNAIKNLKKGEISKPFKSSSGFHILKVTDIKAIDFNMLPESEKISIKNKFFAEELENKFALWIERKKQEAHIKIFYNGD